MGYPCDTQEENERLLKIVAENKPDIVFIDNSKVIRQNTLHILRKMCDPLIVYYSPDDIMAKHNLKINFRKSIPYWDIIFTTKSYNISELKGAGAKKAVLVGNAFDPKIHRPMDRAEVGCEYQRFDVVFVGAFEPARASSLVALAKAGMSVLVYGVDVGALGGRWSALHPNITLRPPAFGPHYAPSMHHGKIALCFLRKINRDQITTRSIEIPAMARAMLAEKTTEHDAHFIDGQEYVSFRDDEELVNKALLLLKNERQRQCLAEAAYRRCKTSGYDTAARARQMLACMERELLSRRHG